MNEAGFPLKPPHRDKAGADQLRTAERIVSYPEII